MAKITLLGSNSGRNAGDAAILASIMRSFHEQLGGDVEFEVPTTNPKFVSGDYGARFKVKPISIMPWTGSIRLLGIPTFRSVKRTDVTMITDGIIFDINLWNPAFNFLITLIFIAAWARLWGKKLVCYNVGIGPLNSYWGRRFARYVGDSCDLIVVRDEDSKRLFEEIGVTKKIHLCADAVFANWQAPESRVDEILKSHGLSESAKEGRLFGVNVTTYIDRWLKSAEKVSKKEAFMPMLAKVLVSLRVDHNIESVVFTTQIMDAEYGRSLLNVISSEHKQRTGEPWRPALISNEIYTNHELIGVASRFQLFVGMRLHSLIISAQGGTPVLGLVYAPKVRSFLKQLGTPERRYELAELSGEKLTAQFVDAWNNRDSIRSTQQAVVAKLQDAVANATGLVCERYFNAQQPAEAARPSVAVGS